MIINKRKISEDSPPYIIAELSANHGGSIDRAKKSIFEASKSGVDAVKIQTYTPETMTINSNKADFLIKDGIWSGNNLYDLYKSAYTPFEWHSELFSYAKKIGITLFSSPFDESAVDLLDQLNTPAYKIASFEIVDHLLIEYISKKNKPIILSTGMANINEISEALAVIRKVSNVDVMLLHCISSYPANTSKSHLNNILTLKNEFNVEVGLSDHTISNIAASVAIGIGAVAIEKHFKLDDDDCGPDSSFSLNIKQLSSLVSECNIAWKSKGTGNFQRSDDESKNIIFRRSLYFVKNMKKGQIITSSDIRRIRPGYGIHPKYYSEIIGKIVTKDVEVGDRVKWEIISD